MSREREIARSNRRLILILGITIAVLIVFVAFRTSAQHLTFMNRNAIALTSQDSPQVTSFSVYRQAYGSACI